MDEEALLDLPELTCSADPAKHRALPFTYLTGLHAYPVNAL